MFGIGNGELVIVAIVFAMPLAVILGVVWFALRRRTPQLTAICPQCGVAVGIGANYCAHCGVRL